MAELRAEGLGLGYGERDIVKDIDITVAAGTVTSIVGANGCGKSTLLRGFSRLLAPRAGHVVLDGDDIAQLSARELARRLGLLPQSPITPEAMTVAELVALGRHPHRSLLGGWSKRDDAAIDEALRLTGTEELANRRVDHLSGGQRQRVWIATVLAQHTAMLLLDEPISFLDISRAVDVLDLIVDLNQRRRTTVVMVLHDLNLAARYSDRLIAMRAGRIVAEGTPSEVVTEEIVEEVFGIACRVVADPVSGTPLVVPIGRHAVRG